MWDVLFNYTAGAHKCIGNNYFCAKNQKVGKKMKDQNERKGRVRERE